MHEEHKLGLDEQAAEQEGFAKRMHAIADRIRAWTKGESAATVHLPGQPPQTMTVDEVRKAKKPTHD